MLRPLLLLACFCAAPVLPAPAAAPLSKDFTARVVLVVWDGMRPDFISETNTPTLAALIRRGVRFANHHSVYPSATEVNGVAISTGGYPASDGIIGNSEYRPHIDAAKPTHTEQIEAVRQGDKLSDGRYLLLPTLAELVRGAGRKAVVAGAKPVALLHDRADRSSTEHGINVYAGASLPSSLTASLTNQFGPFPEEGATKPSRNDWTTDVLLNKLWKDAVPDFTLLWLNEPDSTQHRTGPGSKESLAAIRESDTKLNQVLQALKSRGLETAVDVLVVSDHGCSTVAKQIDLAAVLKKAGVNARREFKTKPARGETLVVSNSGSSLMYVEDHDPDTVQRIVQFLQAQDYTGVIFTRTELPGTFPLSVVHLNSSNQPDVVVSMRWTGASSKQGTPGMIASDASKFGLGQGLHVSLSPFDMHATLVAAGPHFRSGVVNVLPSGNVDIAPTILRILDVKHPSAMNGRILTEALTIDAPPIRSFEPHHIEASSTNQGVIWTQHLNFTEVNGVEYFDEGNGQQQPVK
jgi:predicted AlkP superfamily pyrophosphatase or phosphodiesterase